MHPSQLTLVYLEENNRHHPLREYNLESAGRIVMLWKMAIIVVAVVKAYNEAN